MSKFDWINEPRMSRVAVHVEGDGSYTEIFEESPRVSDETLGAITLLESQSGSVEIVSAAYDPEGRRLLPPS